jgi:opacity protein-like surface antigen
MGGFRVSTNHRVSPYAGFSAGVVHGSDSTSVRVGQVTLAGSISVTKFAVAPNGGVDFLIGRRAGVGIDLAYIKVREASWYGRAGVSVFFRF